MDHVGMSSQSVGEGGAGIISPPKWIPKDKVPRTVSKMLQEKDNAVQTQERGVQALLERDQGKFNLTEQIILELINDDSFMKEVRPPPLPLPSGFDVGHGADGRLSALRRNGTKWGWIGVYFVISDEMIRSSLAFSFDP